MAQRTARSGPTAARPAAADAFGPHAPSAPPPILDTQGLAAGLMLSISIMELLPDAISEIGFVPAQLWFYAGVAFFAVVVALIPEPDSSYIAAAFTIRQGDHGER